jgi:ATP-dependent Clp protease ATP-binding subunit ClpA
MIEDKCSDEVISCLLGAEHEAYTLQYPYLSTYTLLLGMARADPNFEKALCLASGASLDTIRDRSRAILGIPKVQPPKGPKPPQYRATLRFTKDLIRVFQASLAHCQELGEEAIQPHHLLFAIAEIRDEYDLEKLGVDFESLRLYRSKPSNLL